MRWLPLVLCWFLLTGAASRNFDATDDEIDFGNVLNVTTGNVSVCAWWKGTEDASADYVMGKSASNSANVAGYRLRANATGDANAFAVGDGSAEEIGTGNDNDGVWTFVCGTWDGSGDQVLYYENGALINTPSVVTMGSLTTTSNLQMGEADDNSTDANGLIAYGMVYGTSILTLEEIQELFWFPESVPTNIAAGIKGGLWPLWGASTEQDLSGNGVTGTVSGTAATSEDGPPVMFGMGLPI